MSAIFRTQGGGAVVYSEDQKAYVFIAPPPNQNLNVGDQMPAEWSLGGQVAETETEFWRRMSVVQISQLGYTNAWVLYLYKTTPRWTRVVSNDVPVGDRSAVPACAWNRLGGGVDYYADGVDPNMDLNAVCLDVKPSLDLEF